MELLRAVSADRQHSVTRKTADASHPEKVFKSINSNYNEEFADIVKRILMFKTDIADRSSLGSMAEVRDIRLKANATGEDVQAIKNALHEHSVAAENQAHSIQARAIAERDAENLDLQQQNADYKRQITELSNGEAHLIMTDTLVTEAMYM